jgi:hypothetical protein
MARAIQFKSFAFSLLLLALLVSPRVGQAVVLDWDTVTWSGGMSQAFNIDSSNSNNGSTNDVFISISGNTNRFAIAPTVNTNLTGGLSPVENGLFLNMDYTTRTESITVLVGLNYSGGVSNLTFTLFDVDRLVGGSDSGYTDKISSIIGRGTNGAVVLPTITTNAGNVVVGTGSNAYVRGVSSISDTSGVGTVTFTFSTAITNFSFTYGNETNAPSNPGNQWITLYDISFDAKPKVPEWHPGLIAALLCFGLVGVRRFFF